MGLGSGVGSEVGDVVLGLGSGVRVLGLGSGVRVLGLGFGVRVLGLGSGAGVLGVGFGVGFTSEGRLRTSVETATPWTVFALTTKEFPLAPSTV